jgi:hypothetical protein
MRRNFRGKLCAYCAKVPATTDDHVFAGKFFLQEDRGNLPEVPACKECNNQKSALEQYLLSVLPLAGRHSQSIANLDAHIARRLEKNAKLHRELSNNSYETGLYKPIGVAAFEGAKLVALLNYISRGLAWHHWGIYVGEGYEIRVLFKTYVESIVLQHQLHSLSESQRVQADLGNGTIEYEGARVGETPDLLLWVICVYGGIPVANDRQPQREPSPHWWITLKATDSQPSPNQDRRVDSVSEDTSSQ